MQHEDNTERLSAIESDFDYHQFPTNFTLEQIRLGDQWLKYAALALLADSGFYPSVNELQQLDSKNGGERK